jgi:hypothetical protein
MARTGLACIAILLFASCAPQQTANRNVYVSPDAPEDRPVKTHSEDGAATFADLIEPYITKARQTYPSAKRRYLAGLPPGESFFVTAVLQDDAGRTEQVFIAVDRISDGVIYGRIWSNVQHVRGYSTYERYRVSEVNIRDWLITKPDGSEEGNIVGKFIDTLPSDIY